jgi:hypothetical protein
VPRREATSTCASSAIRAAGRPRQEVADRQVERRSLAAEVAADVGVVQHDLLARDAGSRRQRVSDALRDLRVRPHVHAPAFYRHERGVRLQVRLVNALRLELALDDEVCRREPGIDVAAFAHGPAVRVRGFRERLDPGVRIEVGVQQRRRTVECLAHVEDGGHCLVLHLDEVDGAASDLLAVRGDGGDSLAGVAHHVPREHGHVLDLAAVEVLADVGAGDDGLHARQCAGQSRVDAHDAGVRPRAVQQPPVEHAGEPLVRSVARGSGDLLDPVDPRARLPDLDLLDHGLFPPVAARRRHYRRTTARSVKPSTASTACGRARAGVPSRPRRFGCEVDVDPRLARRAAMRATRRAARAGSLRSA